MSRSSRLDQDDAEKIATKLGAERRPGRKHDIAIVRVEETYIGHYGIRRGKGTGHDYIPKQIGVTMREALDLARCNLYRDDYEKLLRERAKLPAQISN